MTKTYMKNDYRSTWNWKDHGGPDLCIGKEFDFGLVIAYGKVSNFPYGGAPYAVAMLVPECKRNIGWEARVGDVGAKFARGFVPGVVPSANYANGILHLNGTFTDVRFYQNLVDAMDDFCDFYGQD